LAGKEKRAARKKEALGPDHSIMLLKILKSNDARPDTRS
jgi:hypothetical protein